MTTTPRISCIAVSGWATPPDSLRPLVDRIAPDAVRLLSWETLLGDDTPLIEAVAGTRGPAVFLGWSLGAMLGLGAMVRGAIEPAAAVLVGCTDRFVAEGDQPGAGPRQLRAMIKRFHRDPEAVIRDFAGACFEDEACAQRVAALAEEGRRMDRQSLLDGLRFLKAFDLQGEVRAVRVPTLVLHGEADRIVPVACGRRLAEALSRGEFQSSAAGHALPLVESERMAGTVRAFLDRCGLGGPNV